MASLKVVFEIVSKGVDQIQKVNGQINAFGKSAGQTFKNLASLQNILVGGIGFAMVSKEISTAVKSYAEQEEASARLQNALGYESQALLDLASQRQKVTKYGDEQTILATAILGDYIKEEAKLKELIPVVQDFATAKRMDLASAADLVVKTLQTENNALKRHGVDVQGAAGSTERFRSAVDGLNAAFAGNAEAVGRTASGQLEIFKNQVGELHESLGKALMPALLEITQLLQDKFVPAVEKSANWISEMVTGFKVVAGISLNDPLRDMTMLNEKIAETEDLLSKRKEGNGFLGMGAKILGTQKQEVAMLQQTLDNLKAQRDELQKKVDSLLSPKAAPTQRKSVVAGGGKPKADKATYDPGIFNFIESVQITESDIVAIEDMITQTAIDAETKRGETLRALRVTQSSELMVSLQEQMVLIAHNYEQGAIDAVTYEQAKTENLRQQVAERKRIQSEEMQHSLWVGDQVLGAIEAAAAAEFQIEKNKREQMKPILRSLAVMRFAAATASGVAKAWETSKTWYEGLALALATVIQNGAMLATQLTSINSAPTGADFVTNGPQMLLVGDNKTGRERVQVTPMGTPNLYGPGGSRNPNGGSVTNNNRFIINDQMTGARLQRALRNGEMFGFVSDLKRSMATV